MEIRPIRRALWPGLALLGATLAAYFPALRGGFIWNDGDYVTQPELRSLPGLKRIWFDLGATQQYYPVLHSAFWLEHRVWGDAPLGYHLINVILHAGAAWLFVILLRRWWDLDVPVGQAVGLAPGQRPGLQINRTKKPEISFDAAFVAGLLFALHPVCVESVAWISEQKNTLSTVFYLLAALGYFRYVDARADGQRSAGTYLLATAWFILALLSKSVTATLPAALLVVVWWRQESLSWRRDIQPLLPWLALGAAGGAFTAWVERRFIGAQGPEFDLSTAQRCIIAGRAVWFYLGKLVWPVHLNFIYPRWEPGSSSWIEYLYPAGVIALLAVLWRLRTRARAPLAAMLLFVGSLFPVLGFLNVYAFVFSFVADHFQYLASLSVLALAAAGWGFWRRKFAGPKSTGPQSGFPLALAAAILGALGVMTWRQCLIYRDLPTFYRRILELNPGAWMAHNNLGLFLAGNGRIPEAIGEYEAGLRLKPDDADMQANLGLALDGAERVAEAIVHYQTALRLRPDYPAAEVNLGKALCETGKFLEAIPHFERALRLKPAYLEARFNLAAALGATGRASESAAQYEEILRLQPGLAAAHHNLAIVLRELGRTAEAHYHDQEAERLKKEGGQ